MQKSEKNPSKLQEIIFYFLFKIYLIKQKNTDNQHYKPT